MSLRCLHLVSSWSVKYEKYFLSHAEMTKERWIASLGISRALDCGLFASVSEGLSEHKMQAEGFHYRTQKDLLPNRETEGDSPGDLVLLQWWRCRIANTILVSSTLLECCTAIFFYKNYCLNENNLKKTKSK